MSFFELTALDTDRILAKSRFVESRSARDTIRRIRNVADKRHEHRLLALAAGLALFVAGALSLLL